MKEKNMSKILRLVSLEKKVARKDLAKMVGITPAGVTKITKKLIDKGYLVEKEKGDSIGGRPPIMLEVNSEKGYLIGVSYEPKGIIGILANLHCEPIKKVNIDIKSKSQEGILEEGYKVIEMLIGEAKGTEILGIGVSMNGLVDSQNGVSIFSPHYRWRDIPMKEILSDRYNVPIYIDNDVRMMAIAEKEYGHIEESSYIMVNIGQGIGAGIVINNEVFQGGSYSAGEIGHIRVCEDGKYFCSCGRKGCLEAEISKENILLQVREDLKDEGVRSSLKDIEDITFEAICKSANNGDYYSIQLIEKIGENIAKAFGSVVNIINPELFIINGEINHCKDILYPRIKLSVQKYSVYNSAKNIEIKESVLKELGAPRGAIAMIYKELFNGILEVR